MFSKFANLNIIILHILIDSFMVLMSYLNLGLNKIKFHVETEHMKYALKTRFMIIYYFESNVFDII